MMVVRGIRVGSGNRKGHMSVLVMLLLLVASMISPAECRKFGAISSILSSVGSTKAAVFCKLNAVGLRSRSLLNRVKEKLPLRFTDVVNLSIPISSK
jgi:hypothetical protein